MKKLVMLLAVLIATPVFAALTISMTDNGDGTVTVGYSGGDAQNPLRAVALEFSLDKGAIVSAVTDYKEDGENESGDAQAFGIYPARIIVELDGTVIPGNYGTPEADLLDPGAGDGSSVKVLEFGSLYVDDINKPGVSGILCKLTIDCNGATDPNLTMVDEDVYRGGVLLEDGTPVPVDQTITLVCAPPPDPNCWTPSECPLQSQGDANCDGDVNLDDLTALKKAWSKSTSDPLGTGVGEYNCCADFNRVGVSKDVINLDDLTALKIGWPLASQTSAGNQTCPPGH